jgi:hypothetical protein
MTRLVALVVSLWLAGSVALAAPAVDLDRAAWEMTSQQVEAALGDLRELPPSSDEPGLRRIFEMGGPVDFGGRTWAKVWFVFGPGDGGLEGIDLFSDMSQIPAIRDWLSARHGTPYETVGRVEPLGSNMSIYVVKFRRPDGGSALLESLNLFGTNSTTVKFKPVDPQVVAEVRRVQRLKELQAAGVAPITGWRDTRWYMTRDEVKALYSSAWSDDLGRLGIDGPFVWLDRNWTVVEFEFKLDIGLTGVRLRAPQSEIAAIDADLRRRYGAPLRVTGSLSDLGNYVAVYRHPESGGFLDVFSFSLGKDQGSGVMVRPSKD